MAIIETRRNPAAVRFKAAVGGFLSGGVIGVSLACCVVGAVLERWSVVAIGVGLFVLNVVVVGVAGRFRRARNPRVPARLALAVIESRRAIGGESADIPVEFVLTVAPDERSAYRVEFNQHINLVDIPDYRPRGVVVVEYRPDAPWDVTIVTKPTEEWARRAANESVDSAPESALLTGPKDGEGAFCLLATLGLLLGGAVVVLLFRADLFTEDDRPTESATSSSSTTTTESRTTSTSTVSGTSTGSMLEAGEMRRAADSLITGMHTSNASELSIDANLMAVRGVLGTPPQPGAVIDLNAIPYERLPALVREARTKLGIPDPTSWRITFEPDAKTATLTIRVTVTDPQGKATLEADAQGKVTKRTPR
ncbi:MULTISPECIES: hypothetical protein [unclassified Embleya]|uniref:hypothetical protein n=1 Tax=unclassified Embleya TaxID=2699296 RepID=UPI0033F4CDD5